MIKFLTCPIRGRAYLINVDGPKELKEFLQKIARPQDNARIGRREPISSANVPPSWKQLINQVARYTDVYSLIYYNPKTKALLHIGTYVNHNFIKLSTIRLTENRNKDWSERYSLDSPDLTLTIL